MILFRLKKATFDPDLLIEGGEEGYTSLIWTERYNSDGEFELKTPFVLKTMKQLPRGSIISHLETREVMMVERHLINISPEGYPELTVSGKSLTAFIDHRHLEGPYPKKKYKMNSNYTAAEAASVILWNCLVNPTTVDVTRIADTTRDVLDTVPTTLVTDSTTVDGQRKKRWLTGGQMGPQVRDLLVQNKLGFRTVRPNSGPCKRVKVTTATSGKGDISYVHEEEVGSLRWDIYNGVDRRRQGPTAKEVIFNYDSGHVDEASYLYSIEGYKTMAYVISDAGGKRYFREGSGDRNNEGLDRRTVWVDGGELDLRKIPDADDQKDNETDVEFRARVREIKALNAADRAEFLEDLDNKGDSTLDKAEEVLLMDGKISPDCPYKYNRDYYLGDKVTLVGQYEFDQTMRVSEYVRTEDADGDQGYPGLVVTL